MLTIQIKGFFCILRLRISYDLTGRYPASIHNGVQAF